MGWFTGWGNSSPFIARTIDGGVTWETQTFDPPDNIGFESISMVNESVGWICGEGGRVYGTMNGGTTSVPPSDQQLPNLIVLSQNYPNPFNPNTIIKYEIPKSSMVRLSVFDMLGREVSVLVDERRDAGVHQVKFDASGLSSGVYLYKLQAGDLVQSRRLVFLR